MYCPVYNSQGEREYRHLNIFYNLLSVTANAAHVFDLGQKILKYYRADTIKCQSQRIKLVLKSFLLFCF
jgi:hypothetical protein